jgi:hypothetical protein
VDVDEEIKTTTREGHRDLYEPELMIGRTEPYGPYYKFSSFFVHGPGRMVGGEESYRSRYAATLFHVDAC